MSLPHTWVHCWDWVHLGLTFFKPHLLSFTLSASLLLFSPRTSFGSGYVTFIWFEASSCNKFTVVSLLHLLSHIKPDYSRHDISSLCSFRVSCFILPTCSMSSLRPKKLPHRVWLPAPALMCCTCISLSFHSSCVFSLCLPSLPVPDHLKPHVKAVDVYF